jgi:hypothetical protein
MSFLTVRHHVQHFREEQMALSIDNSLGCISRLNGSRECRSQSCSARSGSEEPAATVLRGSFKSHIHYGERNPSSGLP